MHIVQMPGKPVGQGYKVYALCEHGYTIFFPYSIYPECKGNEISPMTAETERF